MCPFPGRSSARFMWPRFQRSLIPPALARSVRAHAALRVSFGKVMGPIICAARTLETVELRKTIEGWRDANRNTDRPLIMAGGRGECLYPLSLPGPNLKSIVPAL